MWNFGLIARNVGTLLSGAFSPLPQMKDYLLISGASCAANAITFRHYTLSMKLSRDSWCHLTTCCGMCNWRLF